LSTYASKRAVFLVFFAEFVDGFHECGVVKVEVAHAEGQREEFEGFFAELGEVVALSGSVRGQEDVHRLHRGSKSGGVCFERWIKEGELFAVEIWANGFCATEVEDAKVVAIDKEISWVRVGVKMPEIVNLVGVKIPEGLANPVAMILRCRSVGKDIERLAVHPIHRNHPSTRKLGVVFREADLRQVRASGGEFHRAVEFLLVIGLLQEAGLDFLEISGDIALPQSKNLKGDGFDDAEITAKAFSHSRVLDFHGKRAPSHRGSMNLAD